MDAKAAKNNLKNKIGGWLIAVWGAAILVRSALMGTLLGWGGAYGAGVGFANILAVIMVVGGLYYALRKPQLSK
jgi:predicted phage tail protein